MKDEKEAKKVGLGKNIAMKRKDIVKRWNCLYYKMNLRWGNNVYTTGPYIQRYSGKILPAVDEMEQHEDLAVSGGVKLAREYVQYLKDEIKRQEESNQLKIDYMKKLKNGR